MQFKKILLFGAMCTFAFIANALPGSTGSEATLYLEKGTHFSVLKEDQKFGAIRGRITTSDGSVAPQVSIGLKGTKFGTLTNEDGEYHIRKVPAGTYTLIVSAVGLYPKEKKLR